MVYRVLRAPGGNEVLAEEDDWAVDDGYRLALLGPHDADVERMCSGSGTKCEMRSGCRTWSALRVRWIMRGDEAEGRLVWRDDRPGYEVVVDGHRLTWEEFGDTLEPFEGLTFRLSIHGIEKSRAVTDPGGRERVPRMATTRLLAVMLADTTPRDARPGGGEWDPTDPGRKKAVDRIQRSMQPRSYQ